MSGFDYHPQPHDYKYYIDALVEIVDGKIKHDDRLAVLDILPDEIEAAHVNNDPATAALLTHFQKYLLTHKQYHQ